MGLVAVADGGGEMQDWGERLPLSVEGRLEANPAPGGRFTTVDNNGSFCICHETGRPIGRLDYKGSAPDDRRTQWSILIGERTPGTKATDWGVLFSSSTGSSTTGDCTASG